MILAAGILVTVSTFGDHHTGPAPASLMIGYVAGFVALFILSGIGNGAVYKMIPSIFEARSHTLPMSEAERRQWSRSMSGALIGFAGAVGALGGVGVNLALRQSYLSSGTATSAFWAFVRFYIAASVVTWLIYVRRPLPAAVQRQPPAWPTCDESHRIGRDSRFAATCQITGTQLSVDNSPIELTASRRDVSIETDLGASLFISLVPSRRPKGKAPNGPQPSHHGLESRGHQRPGRPETTRSPAAICSARWPAITSHSRSGPWSVMALFMPASVYGFSAGDKLLLGAVATLIGGCARIPYTLGIAKFGGRNWTDLLGVRAADPTARHHRAAGQPRAAAVAVCAVRGADRPGRRQLRGIAGQRQRLLSAAAQGLGAGRSTPASATSGSR